MEEGHLTTIVCGDEPLKVQDVWDLLPTCRYQLYLVVSLTVLSLPIEVMLYFHPVFTDGDLQWECYNNTQCEQLSYSTTVRAS